jgi:ABC-type glycerol-3-phosphate transport system substrate-binding protein
MSKFQLILTVVFGAFIVIGVMVFAFAQSSSQATARILLWGTVPQEVFDRAYSGAAIGKSKTLTITYIEKTSDGFDKDFVEALASGNGPDVVFLPHDEILKNKNKIFIIPFATYSERSYRDAYVEEGELLLTQDGILGVPVVIDPIVMYWNRDIFNSAGIAKAPAFWDEIYPLSERLTLKDGALNISRATIAFGGFRNVNNAKDVIATLILQAGNPIVTNTSGQDSSVFSNSMGKDVSPTTAALTYYTEFSNPAKPFYSWNPSLPDSQSFFVSGDLALYLGFASELNIIRLKNPNLNFDIVPIPQSRTASTKLTFGRVYAFSIVKNSPNIASAYSAIVGLASSDATTLFADAMHIVPARRDLLSVSPKDAFSSVFNQSALFSSGWRDPDAVATSQIFQSIIETTTGGKARLETAIVEAQLKLQDLIRKQQ